MNTRAPWIFFAGIFAAGCVLPPKSEPQVKALPAQQLGLTGSVVSAVPEGWWQAFGDPQLNRLVAKALADSPTLAQATARVRAAQEAAVVENAGRWPNARLSGQVQRVHAPEKFVIPPPGAGHTIWFGDLGAVLSWDLDFWGKQAAAVEQARALAQVAELDSANARLAVAGVLAQAYLQLDRAYRLLEIAQRAEQQRQEILDVTRGRVDAGLAPKSELRQAEAALPQARVARLQAEAQAQLAVHRLAALSGQGADAYVHFTRPTLKLDAALPLPRELPVNLLARRPDVIAARLRVIAADAQRRVAKAAFYPRISLTALAGYGSIGLSELFKSGSFGYGGGPGISLPLFDAGRLRAQYRGATAQLDEAVAGYNDTVLQAVREAADQITLIASLQAELDEQRSQLEASEDAYRLTEERYKAGLSGYLPVLTTETQVLAARQAVADALAEYATARVTLLLALGGSFAPDPNLAAARGAGAS